MTDRINSLIEKQRSGEDLDFLFFWGHRRRADGALSKSCFSQWYDQGFVYQDDYYRTAEHWMMAEKARLFHDSYMLEQILTCDTPKAAKAYGRKVSGFTFMWRYCRPVLLFSQHFP